MNQVEVPQSGYAYYIDVEGHGAPRYGTLDFEMLARIEPKFRGKLRSAIFVDRIVGINLAKETRTALYTGDGQLVGEMNLTGPAEPRKTKPSKWLNIEEDLTYRFEFECDEPIDPNTFSVRAISHDRHGGSYLTAIEINGYVIDPARFHPVN